MDEDSENVYRKNKQSRKEKGLLIIRTVGWEKLSLCSGWKLSWVQWELSMFRMEEDRRVVSATWLFSPKFGSGSHWGWMAELCKMVVSLELRSTTKKAAKWKNEVVKIWYSYILASYRISSRVLAYMFFLYTWIHFIFIKSTPLPHSKFFGFLTPATSLHFLFFAALLNPVSAAHLHVA